MLNPLKDKTEDEVVEQLFAGSAWVPETPIAQVQAEMHRRLIVAIRDFNTASGKQANTMIGLTYAIMVLTTALGLIALLQAWIMVRGGA